MTAGKGQSEAKKAAAATQKATAVPPTKKGDQLAVKQAAAHKQQQAQQGQKAGKAGLHVAKAPAPAAPALKASQNTHVQGLRSFLRLVILGLEALKCQVLSLLCSYALTWC